MSWSIKSIGKPADVKAAAIGNPHMPQGVKDTIAAHCDDLSPLHGDMIRVEGYGHFGGGYSSIGKLEIEIFKSAPPAPVVVDPPADAQQ